MNEPVMPSVAARSRPGRHRSGALYALAAIAFVLATLFGPLRASGIWDPYELDAADLARRVAVNTLGAADVALVQQSGTVDAHTRANSRMPTLTDLKSGELAFTSMALGFKVFGLRDWSGRVPLAVWLAASVLALYALLARLVHPRAGFYAALAYASMPLCFLQARTMLGDAVAIAAVTLATSGLLGLLFDDADASPAPRVAWGVLAAVGLASGFLARGSLFGVAVPLFAASTAWLFARGAAADHERHPLAADAFAALALGAACLVTLDYVVRLRSGDPAAPLSRVLGVALLAKPPTESSFDYVIRMLGHAAFPWSAFVPFAIGRLFRPPSGALDYERRRETGLRFGLLAAASFAFAAHAFVAQHAVSPAFVGLAALAGVCGLAVFDLDRGAPPSRALGLGVLLLGFVLYRDLTKMPEHALAGFSVDRAVFPAAFGPQAHRLLRWVALAFVGLVVLAFYETDAGPDRESFASARDWARARVASYREVLRELAVVWDGNVVFGLVVIEAALVGLAAMLRLSGAMGAWMAKTSALPQNVVDIGRNAFWAAPLALFGAPVLLVLGRDAVRFALRRAGAPRGALVALAAVVTAGVLGFGFYPALASQMSPKEAFESYARVAKPGETLGLLGVRPRVASYYHRGEITPLEGPPRAFDWLTRAGDDRRWLILRTEELPKLNSLYRSLFARNLPVVDGRSGLIALATNRLDGAPNQNPLGDVVLDDAPPPARPAKATWEDQIQLAGWEVRDPDGALVTEVRPGRPYHMRFYFHVLRAVSGTWKAFIHIDGQNRRYNGDHVLTQGRYPISLWQAGDTIVDDHVFELEPNFTPGDYTVFYGFFAGETRMRVAAGTHDQNRVIAGAIRVR